MSDEMMEQPVITDSSEADILSRLRAKREQASPEEAPEQPEAADQAAEQAEVQPEVEAEAPAPDTEASKEPELVEVTLEGKTYLVPPELKSGIMANADYTRGKQEIAEERRLAAAERTQAALHAQFQTEHGQDVVAVKEAEAELQKLKGVDYSSLTVEDRYSLGRMIDDAKERVQTAKETLGRKHQEFSSKIQEAQNNILAQGKQYLERTIPGWDGKKATEVREYALAEGYSLNEVDNLYDPRFVRTLWKAAQLDKLKNTKPAPAKTVRVVANKDAAPQPSAPKVHLEKEADAARERFRKSGDLEDGVARLQALRRLRSK
jgi:hypothetical protein